MAASNFAVAGYASWSLTAPIADKSVNRCQMCRIERPRRATRSEQRQSIQAGSHRQRNGQEGIGLPTEGNGRCAILWCDQSVLRLRPGPLVKCHVVRVEQMGRPSQSFGNPWAELRLEDWQNCPANPDPSESRIFVVRVLMGV